jgi:hypothetical protein
MDTLYASLFSIPIVRITISSNSPSWYFFMAQDYNLNVGIIIMPVGRQPQFEIKGQI